MSDTDHDLETRSANALIVYAPKAQTSPGATQPRQVLDRALRYARAVLLLWGGVSLAGVGAGGIVYAQGGFDLPVAKAPTATLARASGNEQPGLKPPAERVARTAQLASAVPAESDAAPPRAAEPRASTRPLPPALHPDLADGEGPKPYQRPTPKPKADVADRSGVQQGPGPAPTRAQSHAASVLLGRPSSELEAFDPADPDGSSLLGAPDQEVVARLPQARPSGPAVTRSIRGQQHASYSQRRFRRLRELPRVFRQPRRYHEPEYDYPAPPFFYYR